MLMETNTVWLYLTESPGTVGFTETKNVEGRLPDLGKAERELFNSVKCSGFEKKKFQR